MLTPTLIARGAVFPPAVNRDGSTLVWSDRKDGTRDLYIHKNGVNSRLMADPEIDTEPALTPDGDRLLWSRRVDKDWDIYEMVDGQPVVRYGGEGAQRKPQFSDDGSTLVFENNHGISIVKDGVHETLPKPEGPEVLRRPQPSHDGNRIFWERYNTSARTTELWMRDQDGVEKPLLKPESGWSGYAVSRDGKQLTYSRRTEEGGEDLHVWHLDTGQKTVLADKEAVGEVFPAVSEDGDTTYYNLTDFRGYPKVNTYIFRDHRGEKDELVTRDPSGRDLFPRLSPDDRQLNWMWIADDDPLDRALYVAEVEG